MVLRTSVFVAALSCLLPATAARSQDQAPLQQGAQHWHVAAAQGTVTGDVRYWLEVQPRFDLLKPRLSQVLLRPAIGYRFGKVSLLAGFAWIPSWASRDPSSFSVGENHLWEQLLYGDAFGPVGWQLRTRFEQRLLPGADGVSHRLRSLGRLGLAVVPDGWLSVIVWDEVFFHLNSVDGGPQAGFNENRVFAGLSWRVTPTLTLEGGYMNVLAQRPRAAMRHVLFTFSVWNFP